MCRPQTSRRRRHQGSPRACPPPGCTYYGCTYNYYGCTYYGCTYCGHYNYVLTYLAGLPGAGVGRRRRQGSRLSICGRLAAAVHRRRQRQQRQRQQRQRQRRLRQLRQRRLRRVASLGPYRVGGRSGATSVRHR